MAADITSPQNRWIWVVGTKRLRKVLDRHRSKLALELGKRIASNPDWCVLGGGMAYGIDYHVCSAAYNQAKKLRIEPAEKILTLRPNSHPSIMCGFGTIVDWSSGSEGRRLALVRWADAIITIGGWDAIDTVIDAAVDMRKLVLPVPGSAYSSGRAWARHGKYLKARWGLSANSVTYKSLHSPIRMTSHLAATIIELLKKNL